MRKIVVCLCMLCIFVWTNFSLAAELVNRIVAVVNGEVVTLYDLEKNLQVALKGRNGNQEVGDESRIKAVQKALLDSMVDSILLKQEAERLKITVSPADVQARIKQLEDEQGLTHDEFVAALKKRGLDLSEFKEKLHDKILENRMLGIMVRDKVVVTDEEIRDYFESNKQRFKVSKEVHLMLFSMPDRGALEDLCASLQKGEKDISQIVHGRSGEKSEQEYKSGVQINDLGILNWSDLRPQWQDMLDGLHKGQMSRIFELGNKYAVLYIKELDEQGTSTLAKVKDKIYKLLFARKLDQRYQEYIKQLRSKAVLQIRL